MHIFCSLLIINLTNLLLTQSIAFFKLKKFSLFLLKLKYIHLKKKTVNKISLFDTYFFTSNLQLKSHLIRTYKRIHPHDTTP